MLQKPKYHIKAKHSMTKADKAIEKEIKKEGLHIKHEHQIAEMLTSHANKLNHVEKDLQDRLEYPDWRRKALKEQLSNEFSGQKLLDKIEEELQHEIDYYTNKKTKLENISGLLSEELRLRVEEKVDRSPIGTTYYVDFDNGSDTNDGLGTGSGNAWATLDKFTENARSAGDVCIVRGGMSQTVSSDLTFLSDGAIANPIIIKRDYGDEWSDHVDISGTATATFIFGSKTVTFSADVSGVISAGDWIYNATDDDNTEFAYEVKTVSTTTVTLYLPFKGTNGSSKSVANMGSNPQWNIAAGNYQLRFELDRDWKIQGFDLRGTDFSGVVGMGSEFRGEFKDCILTGNGSSDYGIKGLSASVFILFANKCRTYNCYGGIAAGVGNAIYFRDCLVDGNNVGGSYGLYPGYGAAFNATDSEFKNNAGADLSLFNYGGARGKLRNVIVSSTDPYEGHSGFGEVGFWIEDNNGVIGDNAVYNSFSSAIGTPFYQSETTKIRSGGSNKSIKITPSSSISSFLPGNALLLEIPIYATTDSKTYTIYFASDSTSEWTSNPTASELWIELEAWGHTANNYRKITKSTGTVDFKTDTNFDQSLSVTVAPAQEGVAYLRVEFLGNSNQLLLRVKP